MKLSFKLKRTIINNKSSKEGSAVKPTLYRVFQFEEHPGAEFLTCRQKLRITEKMVDSLVVGRPLNTSTLSPCVSSIDVCFKNVGIYRCDSQPGGSITCTYEKQGNLHVQQFNTLTANAICLKCSVLFRNIYSVLINRNSGQK